MFYSAVEEGINTAESNLSRNEAIDIISGGLIKFIYDYKYQFNATKCERELYYIAKAANALHGEERQKYTALVGLLAALDPHSRDCQFIESKIAEFVGITTEILGEKIELMKLEYN